MKITLVNFNCTVRYVYVYLFYLFILDLLSRIDLDELMKKDEPPLTFPKTLEEFEYAFNERKFFFNGLTVFCLLLYQHDGFDQMLCGMWNEKNGQVFVYLFFVILWVIVGVCCLYRSLLMVFGWFKKLFQNDFCQCILVDKAISQYQWDLFFCFLIA